MTGKYGIDHVDKANGLVDILLIFRASENVFANLYVHVSP